jgi:hypothetical protein
MSEAFNWWQNCHFWHQKRNWDFGAVDKRSDSNGWIDQTSLLISRDIPVRALLLRNQNWLHLIVSIGYSFYVTNFHPLQTPIKKYIDEKGFFEIQDKERVYLTETDNVVRCESHYNKATFLAAVARPWKTKRLSTAAPSGEFNKLCMMILVDWFFNGNIGIYPVVPEDAAKRSYFLCLTGTMVPQYI